MQPKILILTEAGDVHAVAVAEALDIYGVAATLWLTSDFPTRCDETLHFDQEARSSLRIEGPDLNLENPGFDVVWRRRPAYVLDPESLHPADREFAHTECSIFRTSLVSMIAPHAFWINPAHAASRSGSKMLQHQAAASVGLRMPETLYTNSPREIQQFVRRKQGKIVYKPFFATGWSDGNHRFMPYTAILSDESLIQESVRLTPGIYQELIPKAYELRVTVMGDRVFAAKVLSQDTVSGRLDWRRAYHELQFEPTCISPDLREQCIALLRELGLIFGCLDFIVTPQGESIFLEVNETGQFLFLERYCNLPLLDAFANFLLQARRDFEWTEKDVKVRYTDPKLDSLVLTRMKSISHNHVTIPGRFIEESAQ